MDSAVAQTRGMKGWWAMVGDSSWLKDGVVEIERITKAAVNVEPRVIDLPKEKPGTYAIIRPGAAGDGLKDAIEVKVAGPLWHNEQLATPDNLVAFIGERTAASEDGPTKATSKGTVYVGPTGVTYVFDFEDRRDRASVPLKTSKPWDWLVQADAGKVNAMTQRDLIRLLRITFGGAFPAGSNLLSVIRNINFTNNATAEANIQHGNHTLGKNTLNQVRGVNDIPEDFAVSIQVFENFDFPVTVQCALEIYPDVQKFEVVPFPNQLQRALNTTLETIRLRFEDAAPAFLGQVRADDRCA